MAQRGKVLRDTSNGKGLISSTGSQFEFELAGCWKSDVAPKVGMVVEFELNTEGQISSVIAIAENQLAKEQAELVMQAAKAKGMAALSDASARVGTSVLVAWGALVVAWFFLDMVTMNVGYGHKLGISFWNYLSIANGFSVGSDGGKGIYALLAILALAGPAISQFWKDSKAHLGNCLPFALMLGLALNAYISFKSKISSSYEAMGAFAGKDMANLASNMLDEALKSIHIGMGGYIAVAASAYLVFVGLRRFLIAKSQG